MAGDVQITYRDFPPPQLADGRIRERIDRLHRMHPRITACRVVAEAPHRHHQKGRLYSIRIDLMLPGNELVVGRKHDGNHAHEDFFVAVRDAFNAMEHKLRAVTKRHRATRGNKDSRAPSA